jgi:16S rRNA (guanine1207-N2)-methyltransferase
LAEPILDLYRTKQLDWRLRGCRLRLDVPADVFSSFQVDRGTRLLLREIAACSPRWSAALDLGCGYGPIALYLAGTGAAGRVDAIDRDALAVAFTERNARANGLANVAARGGIAYEHVPDGAYDAIVSNVPAKAGETVQRLMLLGAARHLREGGEAWIVVVEPLAERVDEILADESVELRAKTPAKGHVVYRYAFRGRPALPPEPYVRGRGRFEWKRRAYELTAWHGLAEFDKRSWASGVLAAMFQQCFAGKPVRSLAVVEPGQGHVAVLASKIARDLREVTMVSRDLIALRAARMNLLGAGYDGALREIHTAGVPGADAVPHVEVMLATLNEKEGADANVEKVSRWCERCADGGAIVAGKAAFCTRLRDRLRARGLRAQARKKRKGAAAFLLRAS